MGWPIGRGVRCSTGSRVRNILHLKSETSKKTQIEEVADVSNKELGGFGCFCVLLN